MREGNKVICIKSKDNFYKKGKYYRIKRIYSNGETTFVDIDSDFDNVEVLSFTFYFVEGMWNFNDYFSLIRVERRKKLEKLNNMGLWT